MLMTVENTSGHDINAPETITGGTGPCALYAVGGNKTYPLPYPFGHIGTLANGATKQLPMHTRDWRYKSVPWLPMEPSREWQQLVQAGIVDLTVGAETGDRDEENLFIHAI